MSATGENLRRLRKEAGLTTRALEERTRASGKSVSGATISSIELGKRYPRPKTLARLADALGVEVEALTEGPTAKERAEREEFEARAVGAAAEALVEALPENKKVSRDRAYTIVLGRMSN